MALRPWPSAVLTSTCVTTASRLCDRKLLVCSRSSMGSASMMRSMVLTAPVVCSVPSTRWPVSAAVIAIEMVSASRSSPTRITSGSSRIAARTPSAKVGRCVPSSRWITWLCLLRWTNSIGSSRLMMFSLRVRVQQVDHRRERGGLAGAGGAGDQDHALVVVAELLDDRRQAQLVDARDLGRDGAEHGADAGVLAEHVDAEAPALGRHVGEVEVVALAEMLAPAMGVRISVT